MKLKRDKLDSIFSDLVRCRSNFTCEHCGKPFPGFGPELVGLHCSHYLSRAHWATRLDPRNGLAHCAECHDELGNNAYKFREHFHDRRGEAVERELRILKNRVKQVSSSEKEQMYQSYKRQLAAMRLARENGDIGWIDFNFEGSDEQEDT